MVLRRPSVPETPRYGYLLSGDSLFDTGHAIAGERKLRVVGVHDTKTPIVIIGCAGITSVKFRFGCD